MENSRTNHQRAACTAVLGLILFAPLSTAGAYSGGSGTPEDPYQIADANDLLELGATAADYDKHFILTSDIDLSAYTFTQAVIAPCTDGWTAKYRFKGVFDGQGHGIQNLTVNQPKGRGVALFGSISGYAEVSNVCMIDAVIVGGDYVGTIVGDAAYYGIISSCSATGSVQGTENVGGLAGTGNLDSCHATVTVMGAKYVGGLVGSGSCTYCFSTGNVSGTGSYIGGLEGSGSVTSCYATGAVHGGSYVGGLVGRIEYLVSFSYATGRVSGDAYVGGLAGSGSCSGFKACVWDVESSGRTSALSSGNCLSARGHTTAHMKSAYAYSGLDWDFTDADGDAPEWYLPKGSYPRLYWEGGATCYSGGSGTADDPYTIEDVDDLLRIEVLRDYDKHFILTGDIDLEGRVFTRAVMAAGDWSDYYPYGFDGIPFTGTLDGDGHRIMNFSIDAPDQDLVGFFGYVRTGGLIRDLGLVNVNVHGKRYVGGLAGQCDGTILSSSVAGFVDGGSSVGGLIGEFGGTIELCCANVTVSAVGYAGGLVGDSGGDIKFCRVDGAVTSSHACGGLVGFHSGTTVSSEAAATVHSDLDTGGLVGWNYGVISHCRATGDVYGGNNTGGLAGRNHCHAVITHSCATGDVYGGDYVGGLVGCNSWAEIDLSFAAGDVDGEEGVGGLVGYDTFGEINVCFATGDPRGDTGVGGLVGVLLGDITDSYATGRPAGNEKVGGLVGSGSSHADGSFWDMQASHTSASAMGVGKTTAEMMTFATFLDAGWDFTDEDGDAADWMMLREGEDYPRLPWQEVFPGDIAGLYGVDWVDFAEMGRYWGQACPTGCERADIDADGIVGLGDLVHIAADWGEGR